MPQIAITSCAHETTVSIYISYELNADTCILKISQYWLMPLNKYACHIAHVCPAVLTINSTCRPHITHTGVKKQQTPTSLILSFCCIINLKRFSNTELTYNTLDDKLLQPNMAAASGL